MNWRFKKLTPNDTRVNATHLEFFRDEALANPVDALVLREDPEALFAAPDSAEPEITALRDGKLRLSKEGTN